MNIAAVMGRLWACSRMAGWPGISSGLTLQLGSVSRRPSTSVDVVTYAEKEVSSDDHGKVELRGTSGV